MAMRKVLLVGATGETGSSILDGLLESKRYTVSALLRPESSAAQQLQDRGVQVHHAKLDDVRTLVTLLQGIDIVVSAIDAMSQLAQLHLVDAAKQAGVSLFVPCAWIPVLRTGGESILRDQKEVVYNHIKQVGLPYTIIDTGWWYQITFPALPSGRGSEALTFPVNTIHGDGNQELTYIDKRDIGKFVARILDDERTVNQYVYAYSETHTERGIIALAEKISGEKVVTNRLSLSQIEAVIEENAAVYKADPSNADALVKMYIFQYKKAFARGDVSPESAKSLGYLIAKDLYPDLECIGIEDFYKDLLDGKIGKVYAGRGHVKQGS